MTDGVSELTKLSERSRTILRQIVESYLETGEPVGSRNLSRVLPMALSPASIRNVMSDLEQLGLIVAPHTSAGRLPTQLGLRLFVDGLLEVGDLTSKDRRQIESHIAGKRSTTVDDVLREVGEMISGLSHCAGVVLADKQVTRLKHIEFVLLEPGKALVVLVGDDQTVENRIINLPQGLPPIGAGGGGQLSQRARPRLHHGRGARPHRAATADRTAGARRIDQARHPGGAGRVVGLAR